MLNAMDKYIKVLAGIPKICVSSNMADEQTPCAEGGLTLDSRSADKELKTVTPEK